MTLLAVAVVLAIVLLALALSLFLFWRLWFSRKPDRKVPYGKDLIVSPASGTVATVRRFGGAPALNVRKWNAGSVDVWTRDVAESGTFILIVMTPMDVHYQRAPTAGTVVATKHTNGKFINAVKDADRLLTLENERNETVIETPYGRIKVVQIAGMLARRISCFVAKGREVEKGEAIGFIDLGSQVALIVPDTVEVRVSKGQKVVDGETVVGVFRPRPAKPAGAGVRNVPLRRNKK